VEANTGSTISKGRRAAASDPELLGLDLGAASGISPGELDALRRELSGFDVRDVSKMFWRLRMIKTPAEIACMRRAVEIQNAAFFSPLRRYENC
jgi:Xaa-Pro aminopeptidase